TVRTRKNAKLGIRNAGSSVIVRMNRQNHTVTIFHIIGHRNICSARWTPKPTISQTSLTFKDL
ncbi:MAG: hypothetical protein II662_02095, partial [Bacteroidales bacterium]|nr:hypothetical protein [Bacteroidales bacterium]